jgi:NAD(P)-dependent dehydrogenase (short-subunit alcohol dehydrogenase family)
LIPGGEGGKLLLVAPASDAGEHAEAVRAGLENLARTLSVEWARHRITAVAIAPGPETTDEQVAELLGYLLSPAGDYFTGCRLELGAIRPTGRS